MNIWKKSLLLLALMASLLAVGLAAASVWLRPEVELAEVETGLAVQAVPGVVRVDALRSAEIRSEAGGRVARVFVEAGHLVEEGEVLLELDSADLERALARVRAEIKAEEEVRMVGSLLRFDLVDLEEERTRKEELVRAGHIPRNEVIVLDRRISRIGDQMRLEEVALRRRLDGLRHEEARLVDEIRRVVVRSPVRGDVVELFAHPGDLVAPRAAVVRVLSRQRVVEATVSEENFEGVRAGQRATVRLIGYGSRLFPATVEQVLPSADSRTQRYRVHLKVEAPEDLLVPGMTGEASIVTGERAGALLVPRRAWKDGKVWVATGGRVDAREVKLGFTSLSRLEVRDGLREGELVVVEGADGLRPGDRIRPAGR